MTNGDLRHAIWQTLRWRCGAATVTELATATGVDEVAVIDALYDLERQGRVQPVLWRANP